MLSSDEKNILSLIKTADAASIQLALQLIKSNKRYGSILVQYKALFEWLVKHQLIESAPTTEAKIESLAKQTAATFKLDHNVQPIRKGSLNCVKIKK